MSDKGAKEITENQIKEYLFSKHAQNPRVARQWLDRFWIDHKEEIKASTEEERKKIAELFGAYGMEHLDEAIDPHIEKMLNEMEGVFDDINIISPQLESTIENLLQKADQLNISDRKWRQFREKLAGKFERILGDPNKIPLALETAFKKLKHFGVPQERLQEFRQVLIERWKIFLEDLLNRNTNPRQIQTRIHEARNKYGIPDAVLAPFEARIKGNWESFLEASFADNKNTPLILAEKVKRAQEGGLDNEKLRNYKRQLADRWKEKWAYSGVFDHEGNLLGKVYQYSVEIQEELEIFNKLLAELE